MNLQYRYHTERRWSSGRLLHTVLLNPRMPEDGAHTCLCLGKLQQYALREGYGGFYACSLYGLVAPTFADVASVYERPGRGPVDAIGPGNGAALTTMALSAQKNDVGRVFCAWGADGARWCRGYTTATLLLEFGCSMLCIGKAGNGEPRSVLRSRADAKMIPYSLPSYA